MFSVIIFTVVATAAVNHTFIHDSRSVLKSPAFLFASQSFDTDGFATNKTELNATLVSESISWVVNELKSYIHEGGFDTETFTASIPTIADDIEDCVWFYEMLSFEDDGITRHLWFLHRMFRAMFMAAEALETFKVDISPEVTILLQAYLTNVQIFKVFDELGLPDTSQVGYSLLVFGFRKELSCWVRDFTAHRGTEGGKLIAARFDMIIKQARDNLHVLLRAIRPRLYPFELEWEKCHYRFPQL